MRMALAWLTIASAIFIASVAQGAGFDPATFDAFKPGQTTKAEVRQTLGAPTAEMPSLNGHTTLIYQYDAARGATSPEASRLTVVFLFDPNGRFVRYRVYASPADSTSSTTPVGPAPPTVGGPPPGGEPAESATQHAASDAVGIFCVPVLIAGRLPAEDLIKHSQFTRGTQPHDGKLPSPSFQFLVANGDIVEVFADEAKHGCTIHIHGAATAIDNYRAALRAQNWQLFLPKHVDKTSGAVSEGWRVEFAAPAGGAIQVVMVGPAGVADPAKPQVNAIFFHIPQLLWDRMQGRR